LRSGIVESIANLFNVGNDIADDSFLRIELRFSRRFVSSRQPKTVNWSAMIHKKTVQSALGAVLTVLVGLVLWYTHLGASLVDYSYDSLWLFGSRDVTNKITFVMMDTESYETLHQTRGQVWDRGLHAMLLNKLADDNCSIVVMDNFLGQRRDPQTDDEAFRAMKRHQEIALRGGMTLTDAGLKAVPPAQPFLRAVKNNWGVCQFFADGDGILRRHWPFPSPGLFPSLADVAARTAGATVYGSRQRWLRYYGERRTWNRVSYVNALKQPPNFFHGQIVFVGVQPKTLAPDTISHKFKTPYSHWTGECTAGTELLITEFLNLLNQESLIRSTRLDVFTLILAGTLINVLITPLRWTRALIVGLALVAVALIGAVTLTATTNYWFPWMLIAVGQIPVAFACKLVTSRLRYSQNPEQRERPPAIAGWSLIGPPFGHGAYGKVYLAKNKVGDWRAIKIVSRDNFDNDAAPYDREYEGVSRYREICDKHPGLLRVEFLSEKLPTHFYYVMELGDAFEPGWQKMPTSYKPRVLNVVRTLAPQQRLPIEECLRIGLALCDTLDFLHRSGLAHRDIKPHNILFVNGQPKLADLGLITHARVPDSERTAVGTPGYMPPAPEMPGTPRADIYALGMVLYVISTGRSPTLFPELSATLLGDKDPTEFLLFNTIVLKACQPDPKDRYASAQEMYRALEHLKSTTLAQQTPRHRAQLPSQAESVASRPFI
jgi:CHASE2 domain-containing sensor protein